MTNSPQQLYQSQTPQSSTFNLAPQSFDFHSSSSSFFPINSLPQLDRQLVFGAYSGVDGTAESNTCNVDLPGNSGGYSLWEGVDMNIAAGFGNIIGEGGGEMSSAVSGGIELPDSSSAWFMPFNMDPPQIEDVDAGLFMAAGGAGGGGTGSFSERGGIRDVSMTDGQGQP